MKKLILILITVAMVLSGCGEDNTTDVTPEAIANPKADSLEDVSSPAEEPSREAYVQPEMKGEISISLLDEASFITAGAELFMKKYPDIKININVFRELKTIQLEGGAEMSADPEEGFTTDNYLTYLSTQIMSGKADDIILTSMLSMRDYIKMGAFEDLSYYLESTPEINEENYYMNVIEAFRKYGGLYEMPLSFGMQVIYFDKQLVEASGIAPDKELKSIRYSEAMELAKQMVDVTDLPNTYLEIGTGKSESMLIMEDIYQFINMETEQFDFNIPAFTNILKQTKSLRQNGYYDTGTIDFYNMEYHFGFGTDFDSQAAIFSLLPDSSYSNAMPQCDANGDVLFYAYYTFGINSSSENKEIAWEFIKFLLSEEAQVNPSMFNIGINKAALEPMAQRQMGTKTIELGFTLQDCVALLENWAEQANATYIDSDISNIIYEEIDRYYSGSVTEEEIAKAINNKIDKCLNE